MIVDSFNYFLKLSNFASPSWLLVKNPCRTPRWGRRTGLSAAHHKSPQIHNSLEACEKDKTRCLDHWRQRFRRSFQCSGISRFACVGLGNVLARSILIRMLPTDECASLSLVHLIFRFHPFERPFFFKVETYKPFYSACS